MLFTYYYKWWNANFLYLQVAKLEEELSAKNRAFSILEDRLKSQEDYEEIKRELRFTMFLIVDETKTYDFLQIVEWSKYIFGLHDFHSFNSTLKSIEFSNSGEEGGDKTNGDCAKAKSLEMLLLEKNRALQTDNTQLKVASSDLTGKLFI